jgi:ParB/RepB/Spo0J family partition protein
MSNATLTIPLDQIEESPVALRAVNKDGDEYKTLKDGVAKVGVLNAISVRPSYMGDGRTPKTTPDGRPMYTIIDGLHRVTASKELGLPDIAASVLNADDLKVAKMQFIANAARVKTRFYEFAEHLNRLMAADQTMTLVSLAAEVGQSPTWIGKLLGLVGLHPEIGKLVNEGKISVSNAADLARLKPIEEQLKFVQEAMAERTEIFSPKVKARIKELRDAKRAGRDPSENRGFVPTPHYRKKPEVEAELQSGLPNLTATIRAKGITDPVEVAKFVLEYVLHLDEVSVAQAKAKHEQREAERKADAQKRAAERNEARAKEQREAAAKIEAGAK